MSVEVQIGVLLALLTALGSVLGFLYKHRGAVDSPDVEWKRPISSSLALFRNPWYTLGIVVATGSWGFHVGALALAPISLVQSVIAGGLVLLTVCADRLFAHKVTRREWVGVALAAAGLAFLAATLDGTADEAHNDFTDWVLASWVLGVGAAAGFVAYIGADERRHHAGVLLGAAAGLCWAASDTAIKAATAQLGNEGVIGILIDPLALAIAFFSAVGLVFSAKSLQIGKAVPVIAVTSVAANTFTIAAGPIVFGEPMPDDTLGVVVRIAAFVLVIGAAALTPAPVAAAEAELAEA